MAEFALGVAELGTVVSLDGLKAGIDDAEGAAQSGFSKIGDIIGGALKVGLAAAAGGFLALGGAIVSGIGDAREAAQIMAQTEAVIKSTGGAAGYTAQQIADMAGALSAAEGKSLFGDSDIQKGQNLLLTFTNITETLPDATQTMVDMAQAMGTDVSGGAIQLGKALNDPINGISALSRVGVTFTEEQKAQITAMQEAGDMAGAQKVILAELNKEFGGSAEAAAKADGGMAQFKDRLGEIAEGIGGSLLPLLNQFMGFMNDTLLPVVEEIGGQLATAFQTGDFSGLLSSLADLGSNLGAMFGQFAERAGQWILDALPGFLANAQTFLEGMAAWVTESAPGWATALAEFGIRAISWIGEQLPGLAASLGQLYNTMVNWVVDSLPGWGAQLAELGGKIIQWVLDALPGLGANLGAALGVLLGWIIDTIAEVVPKLAELGVQFIGWVATEVLPKLPGALLTIATALYGFISTVVEEVGPKLAEVAGKFLSWVETDVIPYLAGKLDAIKSAISAWVADKVIWAATELKKIGDAIVAGIRAGISGAWGAFMTWIDQQIAQIPQAVRDFLGIKSPSTVFAEIGNQTIAGWLEGMESSFPSLLASFAAMGEELADLAKKIKDTIADTMADIFEGGADLIRQRIKNRAFVADLGKDVAKAREKNTADIAKTEAALADAREKEAARQDELYTQFVEKQKQLQKELALPAEKQDLEKIAKLREDLVNLEKARAAPSERVTELENELALLKQQSTELAERERQMESFRQRQAILLQQAEQAGAMLFKDDPAQQANFFQLRSKQLQEAAKLEEEWFAARTQEDRDRIQAQIDETKKAQELELAAFMQRAQQENATFGDLQKQYEDLIAKRDDLTTKRTEKQTQLAKEKDAKRRTEIEQEIADLDQQIAGTNALIDEVKHALDPLAGVVTTPPTAPAQGLYGAARGPAYPALPNVAGMSAGQMAGAAGGANAAYTVVLRLQDERSSLLQDLIRAEVREELADAGWRGDTRKR